MLICNDQDYIFPISQTNQTKTKQTKIKQNKSKVVQVDSLAQENF